MLRSVNVFFAVFTIIFLMSGCGGENDVSGEQNNSSGDETITFAVTDLVGMEELKRNFEPFQEELSNILEQEVELFPVSDRTAAVSALQSDQADLVLTGPAEYIIINETTNIAPLVGLTRPGYRSAIAVKKSSDYESIEDLEGASIGMSDIGSTSGHLGPSKILMDNGINPQEDVDIKMLGDADLTAFANGDVEAWGGNLPDDLQRFAESDSNDLSMDELRIFEGRELPNDIFIANSNTLSEEQINRIQESMSNNAQALVDSIADGSKNEKYEESEIIEADDSQYEYVRGMYEAIGVNDLTEFVGD
ncbi:PhnD/SsuA/transferrin family substrate-binding protein [Salibacterium aidingense]|uniref:PhnD/SsuA/transferrin family substrate-binding protein n=1 Tax=Salibacterium aidingense TaxID=384933 RepID=UPI003BDA6D2E